MPKPKPVMLEAIGLEVPITNPDKVMFPQAGHTKLDVAKYYLAVAEGALRGAGGRPNVLVRYPNGVGGEFFYQKRAPDSRPPWLEVVTISFPSGRTAAEVVPRNAAALAWMANLGCLELHPHPVRAEDLDHPDELRVDLDPGPGVAWEDVRRVALVAREVLEEHGLRGWPKTSGSRGMHVNVRIERRWSFQQVRRAALALAREVERRAPELATSKWWKEERHGVFIDYNQNAKDRTVASAWSVRPTPDARVSMPLEWDEVPACDPAAFTLVTAPARFSKRGDASSGIDHAAGSLDKLLALSAAQEEAGLGDAPWPPHYEKQAGEPPRVMPSKRRGAAARASSKPQHERNESSAKGSEPQHERNEGGAKGLTPGPSTTADRSPAGAPRRSTSPRERGATAGRRQSKHPLITIAKAERKEDALAGLERWKARYPEAAARLEVDDVLVDAMRGRYTTWTRIRVNLRHVPEEERPAEEAPDPDFDPWQDWKPGQPRPQG